MSAFLRIQNHAPAPGLPRTLRLLAGALPLAAALCLALSPAAVAADVRLPAGSVDGLAGAIAAAGPFGTVILEPGVHSESGTVEVSIPVTILGVEGAVLESRTTPGPAYPIQIHPALHIRGTSRVTVQNLEVRPPAGTTGNTAFLLEDSFAVTIAGNRVNGHQFGVMVQRAGRSRIAGNEIQVIPDWTTGAVPEAHGIVVINGRALRISRNRITGGLFNIWLCDRGGKADGNVTTDGFIGVVLCKVPVDNFLISGSTAGSDDSGNRWNLANNFSARNDWGYLLIDGANNNSLLNNAAADNRVYDIELTMDTFRFGFLTPAAFENTVDVGGQKDLIIKDCGIDNAVNAETVDTTLDPCF